MKKIFKISFVFMLAILLTGCKKQVVTKCSLSSDQSPSGYTIETNYQIYSIDNEVNKVKSIEVVESKNKTVLSYFKKQLEEQYKSYNKEYGGYEYNITNKDGKVTVDLTIDYTKMDITKFVNDNPAMKEYVNKDNKITLKGIKAMYNSIGATCKK